jgi:RND superfamily putative drug exporter
VTRNPWYVVIGWVVVGVLVVLTAPKVSATSDQSQFLPGVLRVDPRADLQTKAFPQQVGALVVFDRADGRPLTAADSGGPATATSSSRPSRSRRPRTPDRDIGCPQIALEGSTVSAG